MRILVSTDNHCGYGEVKKVNYDDAFVTLDEVFDQARSSNVDLVLLGFVLFRMQQLSYYFTF
jgi:DNA repair exonuclease SbcCD nuclease subunit